MAIKISQSPSLFAQTAYLVSRYDDIKQAASPHIGKAEIREYFVFLPETVNDLSKILVDC